MSYTTDSYILNRHFQSRCHVGYISTLYTEGPILKYRLEDQLH